MSNMFYLRFQNQTMNLVVPANASFLQWKEA